jgi:hypothetical protein
MKAVAELECQKTCKETCTAMELTTRAEREAIMQYAALRDMCTYPPVKAMLNQLIIERTKSIKLLEQTRIILDEKFGVLDQIRGHMEEDAE